MYCSEANSGVEKESENVSKDLSSFPSRKHQCNPTEMEILGLISTHRAQGTRDKSNSFPSGGTNKMPT